MDEQPIKPIKPKRIIAKKADLNTKIGRYFLNKQTGITKKEAALRAGYADAAHISTIEKSRTYQALEQKYFKDELLQRISMGQISEELIKNITQDDDKGAKNKSIEIALNRLEPDMVQEQEERVLVILK